MPVASPGQPRRRFLGLAVRDSATGGPRALLALVVLPSRKGNMCPEQEQSSKTGCGAAWLARLTGGQEVGSSNLPSPTQKSSDFDGMAVRGAGGMGVDLDHDGSAASRSCPRHE
jgi:hypothetical protein